MALITPIVFVVIFFIIMFILINGEIIFTEKVIGVDYFSINDIIGASLLIINIIFSGWLAFKIISSLGLITIKTFESWL